MNKDVDYCLTHNSCVESLLALTSESDEIIEFGPGMGGNLDLVISVFDETKIKVFSNNNDELIFLKKKWPGLETVFADANEAKFEDEIKRTLGKRSLIIASHFIEHLARPQKFLVDIAKYARPYSQIILVIPNVSFWRYRLKLLIHPFHYEPAGIFDNTHLRFFSCSSFLDLISQFDRDFTIEQTVSVGSFPLPILRKLMPHLAGKIDMLAAKTWPDLFSSEVAVLLSRNPK